jgi:peptidoglycan/LPS O-acetylase OafA/YrhL
MCSAAQAKVPQVARLSKLIAWWRRLLRLLPLLVCLLALLAAKAAGGRQFRQQSSAASDLLAGYLA